MTIEAKASQRSVPTTCALLLAIATATIPGSPVWAQDNAADPNALGLSVIVGGGGSYEPVFNGSAEYQFSADPLIQARFKRLFIGEQGVGINLLQDYGPAEVNAGVAVGLGDGRSEADDPLFRGLGDLDDAVELSAFAEAEWGWFEFSATVAQDVADGHQSLFGMVGVSVEQDVTDRLSLELGVSATIGSEGYVQALFGVSPAQSARSGYAATNLGAGLTNVDVEVTVTYDVTENWFLQGTASGGMLTGDARDAAFLTEDVYGSISLGIGRSFSF